MPFPFITCMLTVRVYLHRAYTCTKAAGYVDILFQGVAHGEFECNQKQQ